MTSEATKIASWCNPTKMRLLFLEIVLLCSSSLRITSNPQSLQYGIQVHPSSKKSPIYWAMNSVSISDFKMIHFDCKSFLIVSWKKYHCRSNLFFPSYQVKLEITVDIYVISHLKKSIELIEESIYNQVPWWKSHIQGRMTDPFKDISNIWDIFSRTQTSKWI